MILKGFATFSKKPQPILVIREGRRKGLKVIFIIIFELYPVNSAWYSKFLHANGGFPTSSVVDAQWVNQFYCDYDLDIGDIAFYMAMYQY